MSGSAPRTATAALHQESFQRAGTWTHKNPGPFGPITAENRAAIQRLLAVDHLWPHLCSANRKLSKFNIGPASGSLNGDQRDSVLQDLEISTIRKDSKGTWQFHSQRDPDALPIYCKTCSPSKKGRVLYFKSFKAWRVHALQTHSQDDACFMKSLDGDPVRSGVWYCSQCHERTQIAQLFGRKLETKMARKTHYSNVHDRGAVIALEDCSADDRRGRVQACNESWQEEQIRATHYDTESDSEDHMAPWDREGGFLSSGAVQPAQLAPDRTAVEPIASRTSESSVRSRRVMNCSIKKAEQQRAATEYRREAEKQIQAYMHGKDMDGTDEQIWGA